MGAALSAAHASAQSAPIHAPLSQGDRGHAQVARSDIALFLDVTVNGAPRGMHPFVLRQDALLAQAKVLRALDVKLPPGGPEGEQLLALDELPDLQVDYDGTHQRLALNASLEQLDLPRTQVGVRSQEMAQAATAPGLLLNYDLFGMAGRRGSRSLSAFTETRAFWGNNVVSNTALTRTFRAGDVAGWRGESARLDTTWTRSYPEQMLSLRVGDTVTSGLPWSRATRIGGIQLARNFSLQPYRTTAPLPAFLGSATLPSQVDLFVNGMRQFSGDVPPGPFEISGVPTINSAGNAQVVLTDALGRSTTLDFSIYDTDRLLEPGLSDWSVELGFVRRNYGIRSFDYGSDPVLSGTWRHGVNSQLTVETHAEATRALALVGGGGVWHSGAGGSFTGGLAYSSHDQGHGALWSLGYTLRGRRFSTGIDVTRTTENYRDVAAYYGSRPARASGRVHVGYSTQESGSFALGYVHRELHKGDRDATFDAAFDANGFLRAPRFLDRPFDTDSARRSRYATASWTRSLGPRASISVSLTQNVDVRKDRALSVGLTLSLDPKVHTSASMQHGNGRNWASVNASQSTPSEGGWGWRTSARMGDAHDRGAQGEVRYLGRYGRVEAGAQSYGSSRYLHAGASGALVFMGGHGFASRRIDDGFALVSTAGYPGVPVTLHNRLVGVTNDDGVLLITPMGAYLRSPVGIDTLDLPANVRADRVRATATPADRGGTLVEFNVQRVRSAMLVLVDAEGRPLPQGSIVQREGAGADEVGVVGFDGQTYMEGLGGHNVLQVQLPQGKTCEVAFDLPEVADGIAQLGPLACTRRT